MRNTFICYLHKPGALTPELRCVASPSRKELPDVIMAELATWGLFDVIDVYDDRDRRLFSFSASPHLVN